MSAITTATIVGVSVAAASVASQQIAAKKQRDAAKAAAQTQTDAATTALEFQKGQYNQSRQDFDPYQQSGASALQRLQAQAQNTGPTFRPGQGQMGSLANPTGQIGPGMQGMGGQASGQPQQGPGMGPLPPNPFAGGAISAGGQAAMGQGPSGGAGGMVTLRAQDGETRAVPSQVAQQLLARPGGQFTRVG